MNSKSPAPQRAVPSGRGPGSGGPMQSRVFGEKPKNIKKTLKRLIKYIGSSKHLFY
jgi:hypothetical protein